MDKWYKMDVLRNISGPYDIERIKQFARDGLNFWVGAPDAKSWSPVDAVRGFCAGLRTKSGAPSGETHRVPALERSIDELIGLCKGIIADGKVDIHEAEFLKSWLENNREIAAIWPANVLSERIAGIFADGVADEEERIDLGRLLAKFTGVVPGVADAEQMASRLPIDEPCPDVAFEGRSFLLTGNFVYGSRRKCENMIVAKGGECHAELKPKTDYLVIGALGSPEWRHSPYGEEVEAVFGNREQGSKTAIVSEEHWTFFL